MPENTTAQPEPKEVETTAETTAPAASAETKADDTQSVIEKLTTEAQNALRIAEDERKIREKAEKKIVDLKRQAKEKNVDLEDDAPQPLDPEAIAQRAAEIAAKQIAEQNANNDSELATARTTINELTETLKAKATVGNSGAGNNQDRYEPEQEEKLSPADRQLIERRAQAAGVTVKEYLKAHPLS